MSLSDLPTSIAAISLQKYYVVLMSHAAVFLYDTAWRTPLHVTWLYCE
jgi:hypothetical protein